MPSGIGAFQQRLKSPAGQAGRDDARRDIGRLLITCPDRPGIVAAVSRFLFDRSANILASQQYSTNPFGGTFFILVEFHLAGLADCIGGLRKEFEGLSDSFSMRWKMTCAADTRMVVSNHEDLAEVVAGWGIAFHHVPVSPQTRFEAESAQLELLREEVDLVVLARYMQILSPRFLATYPQPIINIHHSFLPAFVGANPYEAAAERGVKLVGATAHYVTAELDAGPIIEQDIVRVDHRCSADDLRRLGRHVERSVLARAVGWHLDDRVIVHQNKTIVFS